MLCAIGIEGMSAPIESCTPASGAPSRRKMDHAIVDMVLAGERAIEFRTRPLRRRRGRCERSIAVARCFMIS
jgi:hypothetical protein